MSRPPEPVVEESVGCIYCPGQAQPEQDGDLLFYVCARCGGEFGQRRIEQPGPVCAAGLPIDVIVDPAQPPGVVTIDTGAEQRKVFLGVTIKRRPE